MGEASSSVTVPLAERRRRAGRRLSDKLLAAFNQACDQNELEVAAALLHLLEQVVGRRPDGRRREDGKVDALIEGYQRLWLLRHPEVDRAAA